MIETERTFLRSYKKEDTPLFRKLNADPRVMEFYPSISSDQESDQMMERMQGHIDLHGFGLWALELKEEKRFIGFVGLQVIPYETHFTPAVEIGWRVDFNYWNRGLATEAAKACLEYAFQTLRLKEIVAMTYKGNHRSRKVMEKLGMIYNPQDDFLHPKIAEGHLLKPHVLYRLPLSKYLLMSHPTK